MEHAWLLLGEKLIVEPFTTAASEYSLVSKKHWAKVCDTLVTGIHKCRSLESRHTRPASSILAAIVQ